MSLPDASYPTVALPELPAAFRPRGGTVASRALGRFVVRLSRFRIVGAFPDVPHMVCVVAPHTSNWDGVVGLAAVMALGLRVRFLAKHTLFRGPLGWALRALGGIPVNRAAPGDLVASVAEAARRDGRLLLGVTPEGTRRRVDRWKTGYHRIARALEAPVVLVKIDWGRREVGPFATVLPTPDAEADTLAIRRRFADVRGRHPEHETPLPG